MGSNACGVIASLVGEHILRGRLQELFVNSQLSMTERSMLVECIVEGNDLYDRSGQRGLLTADVALGVVCCSSHIAQEMFVSHGNAVQWSAVFRRMKDNSQQSKSHTSAALVVTTPFTIVVGCDAHGHIFLFDSHSHPPNGACIVTGMSVESASAFMSSYFQTFLGLSDEQQFAACAVPRQYHCCVLDV